MKREKMGSRRDRARLAAMEQSMRYPYTMEYWYEESELEWTESCYFSFYDNEFQPYYDDYWEWRDRNDV